MKRKITRDWTHSVILASFEHHWTHSQVNKSVAIWELIWAKKVGRKSLEKT